MSWIVNNTYIHFDILLYMDIPSCPTPNMPLYDILPQHIATMVCTAAISIFCFILGMVILVRYNSIKVLNRKVNTPSVSNRNWILYYFVTGFKFAIVFLRYIVLPMEQKWPALVLALQILLLIFNGLTPALLAYALHYQLLFRGTNTNERSSKVPLIICYFLLFYYALMILEFILPKFDYIAGGFIFLIAIVVQNTFTAVIIMMIVYKAVRYGGPRKSTLIFLILFLFGIFWYVVPVPIWTFFICGGIRFLEPYRCPFYIASIPDVMYMELIFPYLMLFLFVRSEYTRNVDEARWNQVSRIEDMLDFE